MDPPETLPPAIARHEQPAERRGKEGLMTVRMRGFLIFAGSLVVGGAGYWLLFRYLTGPHGEVRLPAYPLALPLVGVVIGLLEWVTGLPMSRIDEGWQRLPWYGKVPVALFGGVAVLWAFLWIVAKSLGA
jgi:hypothetical protein